jgi:hypothetical protein
MDLAMHAARASGADLPAASVAQSVLASNLPSSGDLDLAAITPFVVGIEEPPRLSSELDKRRSSVRSRSRSSRN